MRVDTNGRDVLVVVSIGLDEMEIPMENFSFDFSWLCCYMAQMNPLIGPKLHQNTILIMAKEWGNPLIDDGWRFNDTEHP